MSDEDLWGILQEDDEVLLMENVKLEPLLSEIDSIQDESIKSFTRAMLLAVDTFWVAPSSPSGKYHPPDEYGEGGDVLHTKRVVAITKLLAESQEREDFETDMLVSAAILHDITKVYCREDGSFKSDTMHPLTVTTLFEKLRLTEMEDAKKQGSKTTMLDFNTITEILRLVRCHMGPWSPIPEVVPITPFEMTVHWADMIAANLHKVVDFPDEQSPAS